MLALSFGYLRPEEMLGELSASELNDWWAYYQVEPWGPQRDDGRVIFQTGLIGSLLGGKFESALALPSFIDEIYGPPQPSPETLARLDQIRDSRQHD